MKIHNYPGFFVDIEGLDGSGASTQVALVSQKMKEMGIQPFATKEPTNGPVGELIRKILKGGHKNISPVSLRLLFAADGGFHLDQEIIPRLKKGRMVITDRYAWSSVAFGSVDLSKEWLFELNKDFILPDLTFFIEVEPDVCLERLVEEKKGVALFRKKEELMHTWDTYRWLAEKYWWAQITMVDGEKPEEEVAEAILARLKVHPKFKKMLK